MPRWLMKTADDTYREWSTVVDDWVAEPVDREAAVAEHGENRVRFTDEHLCSCRARLGEQVRIVGGKVQTFGGGRLAYHFDSYVEVARFCRTQAENQDTEAEHLQPGAPPGGNPAGQSAPIGTVSPSNSA